MCNQELFSAYAGNPPRSSDLVTYWFQLAAELLLAKRISAFGLVATKSIAKGASNEPLRMVTRSSGYEIFAASQNEEWVVDGAEVRVSIVCCRQRDGSHEVRLNDQFVSKINSDLTTGVDIGSAIGLASNKNLAFQGIKANGPFEISPTLARKALLEPVNPNGRTNADVVKRYCTNDDVTGRDTDSWILDFTLIQDFESASLYERPFNEVKKVKVYRDSLEQGTATENDRLSAFWIMQRPRMKLRSAIALNDHVIATPETSEHRVFRYLPATSVFSGSLFVFSRTDHFFFGMLHSRIHEVWSRRQGNKLGVGNQGRYNVTVTFETFPFPNGLTPNIPAADYAADPRAQKIAAAAARLNEFRENWLNPPDLVKRVPEVVPGYPDRILPKDEAAAEVLKKRTLTNLYNQRPQWLDNAHKALDEAVAEAYGWGDDWRAGALTDDEILARLFKLNQQRAAAERA